MKLGSLDVDSPYFLAPMAGYTDKPFRHLCKTFGAGLTVSELVSVNAIYYKNKKTDILIDRSSIENPFSVQLFGSSPEIFLYAAQSVEHKCDCIDINAGCPVAKVVKAQAGSYLLKDKNRLLEILDLLKKHLKVPVSIKLRKGFDENSVNDTAFYKELELRGADFIVIHPRLRGQFFKGDVDYAHVANVREKLGIEVVVNGGIDSYSKLEYVKEITGCRFFMIGQSAIVKPYIFEDLINKRDTNRPLKFVKQLMKNHFSLMVEHYEERVATKNFRKFFHKYIKGIKNSKALKEKINECGNAQCVFEVMDMIDDGL